MTGCAARAKTPSATPAAVKPAAPAAPPAPVALSAPQTQVVLPKPQPVDSAAFDTAPTTPADTTATKPPAAPPPRVPRTVRTDVAPPPPVAPAETPRPQFQEVISATDFKRLQESVANRKREVSQILDQIQKRHLNNAQKIVLGDIRGLIKLSEDYEKRNEMPQADTMAERAQLLARQLLNGK
jgi:hypothetical protein